MRTKTFEKRHVWRGLCTLALIVACGGATSGTPVLGGETHFLRSCATTCEGGLSCVAGICTRGCVVAEESCADLAADATCTPASVEPGAVAVCDLGCNADAECISLGGDYTCPAGFCRAPALASVEPAGVGQCPAFEAGIQQPMPVSTTATAVPGAANVALAYADDSGLYWIDRTGGVFALPTGAASPVTLVPGSGDDVVLTGFVADADTLVWGEATRPEGISEPGPPRPPARLRVVPKVGGTSGTIFASDTTVYEPLEVQYGGLVLRDVTSNAIYSGNVSGGEAQYLIPDPAPSDRLVSRDNTLFYRSPAGTLRRLALSGGPPEDIAPIDDTSQFTVGTGFVLWTRSQTVLEPLTLVESLRMLNEATGCVQELPSLGLSISLAGLDAEHVYWKSYNGLGAVSPGTPFETLPLVRVNLRTGVLESITAPGFEPTVVTDYATEDSSALYFRVNGGLVAVAKP